MILRRFSIEFNFVKTKNQVHNRRFLLKNDCHCYVYTVFIQQAILERKRAKVATLIDPNQSTGPNYNSFNVPFFSSLFSL